MEDKRVQRKIMYCTYKTKVSEKIPETAIALELLLLNYYKTEVRAQ